MAHLLSWSNIKAHGTRQTDTRYISYLIDTFVAIDKPELLPGGYRVDIKLSHHYAVCVSNLILIVVVNGAWLVGRGEKGTGRT